MLPQPESDLYSTSPGWAAPPKVNTGSYVATHKGTDCETVFTIFSIRLAAGLLVTITRSFVSASVKSDSFVPRTTTRQQYIDACW